MSCGTAKKLEVISGADSPVHRLDGRVKIIFLFIFCATVVSFPAHEVPSLIPFFIFPVSFAVVGRIPFALVSRILLLMSPFALSLVVLNPFLDTRPVAIHGLDITISAGWLSFISVLLRFALTVSMIIVFTASTPLPSIVNGMLTLRVPSVLVTQIHLICRYIFLLADEGERISHAWKLRSPGRRLPEMRIASFMLSSLLVKCYERAEKIYFSMKARGFTGTIPFRSGKGPGIPDIAFLVTGITFCIASRIYPLTYWAGKLAIGS